MAELVFDVQIMILSDMLCSRCKPAMGHMHLMDEYFNLFHSICCFQSSIRT